MRTETIGEAWFRYVRHADVARFTAAGWRLVDDLATTCHGRHAVLMQWEGAGEPT